MKEIKNETLEKISEELKEQKKISRALYIEFERLKNDIEKLKEYVYE
jgi:archaellum component FlaC